MFNAIKVEIGFILYKDGELAFNSVFNQLEKRITEYEVTVGKSSFNGIPDAIQMAINHLNNAWGKRIYKIEYIRGTLVKPKSMGVVVTKFSHKVEEFPE